jgi:hypothetical protein
MVVRGREVGGGAVSRVGVVVGQKRIVRSLRERMVTAGDRG